MSAGRIASGARTHDAMTRCASAAVLVKPMTVPPVMSVRLIEGSSALRNFSVAAQCQAACDRPRVQSELHPQASPRE